MRLLERPVVVGWLVGSFSLLILAVVLTAAHPNNAVVVIAATIVTLFAGSIFFPILVSYFYDRFKDAETGEAIWKVFRELSDAGIVRVYRDREESRYPENAVTELRNAFLNHREGEIRLVGVSLRVFFNGSGAFYDSICRLAPTSTMSRPILIRALVLDPASPEVRNRAEVEAPDMPKPLIYSEIALTIANIQHMMLHAKQGFINVGYYNQAPYCTAVIFPDRCFFSPNLISNITPVKLPLIVFRSDSHGYRVLSQYFEALWAKKKDPAGSCAAAH